MEEIQSKISALDTKQYYQLGGSSSMTESSETTLEDDIPYLDDELDLHQNDHHPDDYYDDEVISDCESEDVDTIVHRYDPPNFQDIKITNSTTSSNFNGVNINSNATTTKSIAEELQNEIKKTEFHRSGNDDITNIAKNVHSAVGNNTTGISSDKELILRSEPPPDILMNCRRKIWPNHDHQDEIISDFNEDWDMVLENEPDSAVEDQGSGAAATVDIVIRQEPSSSNKIDGNGSRFYKNSRRMIVHQVQGVENIANPNCGNCCILQ